MKFIKFINDVSPYQDPDAPPIDIEEVIFSLNWIRFDRYRTTYFGRTDLLCIEGVFEWNNKRYSFRHGIGFLSGEFEIFFNGPHVIKEYRRKEV